MMQGPMNIRLTSQLVHDFLYDRAGNTQCVEEQQVCNFSWCSSLQFHVVSTDNQFKESLQQPVLEHLCDSLSVGQEA